ncbi:hypothetical protein [Nonomuraea sp. NPDC002799]
MKSLRRWGPAGLLLIGFLWFVSTAGLASLSLHYGFALAGAEARNAELGSVLMYAVFGVGVGGPILGLLVAVALRSTAGMWFYGLVMGVIVVPGIVLALMAGSASAQGARTPTCTTAPGKVVSLPQHQPIG